MARIDKSKFSANFKRDYGMIFAVALFFLIVVAEVVIAIGTPILIRQESVWAQRVARQRMISSFDYLQAMAWQGLKEKKLQGEASIFVATCDLLGIYLRENSGKLNAAEIASVSETLEAMQQLYQRMSTRGGFSGETELKFNHILKEQSERLDQVSRRVGLTQEESFDE
ncbi:MAG: hypothetical protein PHS41_06210 [Victivallaceae bacterium]|nr:hypothetical protein [Victivallaceae bacterium]